jgi:hypothetical protein
MNKWGQITSAWDYLKIGLFLAGTLLRLNLPVFTLNFSNTGDL